MFAGAGIDAVTGGIDNDWFEGGADNDILRGNGGSDRLDSGAGNDSMFGGIGNDILIGRAGNDILIGGLGRDVMAGGAHNDTFRFLNKANSPVGNPDVITDFDNSGNNRIDVSALFGPAMIYRHNGGFHGRRPSAHQRHRGCRVIVQANTGGSLAADFAIRLAATTLGSMTGNDFIL